MKIKKPDYNIGETVIKSINSFTVEKIPCVACEGSGFLIGKDSWSYKCPKCSGNKHTRKTSPCTKEVKGTVNEIIIRVNKHGAAIDYEVIFDGALSIVGENEIKKGKS